MAAQARPQEIHVAYILCTVHAARQVSIPATPTPKARQRSLITKLKSDSTQASPQARQLASNFQLPGVCKWYRITAQLHSPIVSATLVTYKIRCSSLLRSCVHLQCAMSKSTLAGRQSTMSALDSQVICKCMIRGSHKLHNAQARATHTHTRTQMGRGIPATPTAPSLILEIISLL